MDDGNIISPEVFKTINLQKIDISFIKKIIENSVHVYEKPVIPLNLSMSYSYKHKENHMDYKCEKHRLPYIQQCPRDGEMLCIECIPDHSMHSTLKLIQDNFSKNSLISVYQNIELIKQKLEDNWKNTLEDINKIGNENDNIYVSFFNSFNEESIQILEKYLNMKKKWEHIYNEEITKWVFYASDLIDSYNNTQKLITRTEYEINRSTNLEFSSIAYLNIEKEFKKLMKSEKIGKRLILENLNSVYQTLMQNHSQPIQLSHYKYDEEKSKETPESNLIFESAPQKEAHLLLEKNSQMESTQNNLVIEELSAKKDDDFIKQKSKVNPSIQDPIEKNEKVLQQIKQDPLKKNSNNPTKSLNMEVPKENVNQMILKKIKMGLDFKNEFNNDNNILLFNFQNPIRNNNQVITDKNVDFLLQELSKYKELVTSLDFNDNRIGDEGFKKIITYFPNLKNLNFSNNKITNEGVDFLSRKLSNLHKEIVIELGGNKGITQKGKSKINKNKGKNQKITF